MLDKIRNALRTDASAAALETIITDGGAALQIAQAEKAAIAKDWAAALVTGSEAELDTIEVKRNANALEIERLEAALEALTVRLAETREQERAAAVDAQVAAAQAAQDRGIELLHDYERHAKEIAGILEQLKGAHATIRAAHAVVMEAAQPSRRVVLPERILSKEQHRHCSIPETVVLPCIDYQNERIWPPRSEISEPAEATPAQAAQ